MNYIRKVNFLVFFVNINYSGRKVVTAYKLLLTKTSNPSTAEIFGIYRGF